MSDKSELMVRAEQVLLDMVNKAAELGSAAVDEIPLVVQELLTWHFALSMVYFIFSIALFLLLTYVNKVWWVSSGKPYNPERPEVGKVRDFWDVQVVLFPTSLLFNFFLLLPVLKNLDWLKIWLAPRVYLLEYAAQLIK